MGVSEEESDFALIANMCNTKESIKARNDDEYKATARGQMSVILDSEDSHDEVLLERIAYTVAKAGVELDETDVVVRAAENMKGKKMEKQLSEEPKKPKRLGKKKAAIAERKAAREATAKAKESGVGGGDIASESSDTMDSKPELSNVTGPTSESQTRSDSTDPTSTSESSSGSEPSQQKQSA